MEGEAFLLSTGDWKSLRSHDSLGVVIGDVWVGLAFDDTAEKPPRLCLAEVENDGDESELFWIADYQVADQFDEWARAVASVLGDALRERASALGISTDEVELMELPTSDYLNE